MRKLKTLLTALLAIAGFSAIAQTTNSLLWRISGKQMNKPSYLFGTMHLICRSDFIWTEAMKASLTKSEKVCFEMDMDDNSVMMEAAAGLVDHSGKRLREYFTPEQYTIVSKYIKENWGMDIGMMDMMKPVALQTLMVTQGPACSDAISYEDSIMKTAQLDKKEIIGLEEVKEQLDVLEHIPADTVISELMSMIEDRRETDSEYAAMVQAYKTQDLPALYRQMSESKELKNEMGIFLDDRNKRWIPRMEDRMKKNSVFFAVGAGHLWGDNGVINLLRREGYTVEAVK